MPQSVGLIPAHAGKTCPCRARLLVEWAHPRSRGENLIVDRPANPQAGSSPLTRGKPSRRRTGRPRGGLIPAHAGKTGGRHDGRSTQQAHPRSRGENEGTNTAENVARGSSPLTRGKRRVGPRRPRGQGLIPAHAGKTVLAAARPVEYKAHPRSRGENSVYHMTGGTEARLIPAHAGKTPRRPSATSGPRAHPRSRGEN